MKRARERREERGVRPARGDPAAGPRERKTQQTRWVYLGGWASVGWESRAHPTMEAAAEPIGVVASLSEDACVTTSKEALEAEIGAPGAGWAVPGQGPEAPLSWRDLGWSDADGCRTLEAYVYGVRLGVVVVMRKMLA